MLYTICIGLILVACVLMVLAVLVQSPKGGMAANFGASNQVMGVRQTSDFLEKFTWAMAITILFLSLVATVVMDGPSANAGAAIDSAADALMQSQPTTEMTMPQAADQVEMPVVEAPVQE